MNAYIKLSLTVVSILVFTSFNGLLGIEYTVSKAEEINPTLNKLLPGDVMYIAPGDYYPPVAQPPYNHLLVENRSGTPSAWITVRNLPGQPRPKIYLGGSMPHGFAVRKGAYWRIEGLEIIGRSDDQGTNGFFISEMHHVQIVNCVVRNMGASGISLAGCSQVLIEGNYTYGNCKKATYGPSGISVFEAKMLSSDNSGFAGPLGNPNNRYAIIVRNNKCWDNICYIFGSDGNGIIIDCFNDSGFTGYTLVANNICFYNGMAGIHILKSNNVDVVHNTCYFNQRQYLQGEISAAGSGNCRYFNNIMYPDRKPASYQYQSSGQLPNQWANNLQFNYEAKPYYPEKVTGINDVLQDPLFIAPGITESADFRLQSNSPAINAGNTTILILQDYAGASRIGTPDIGAYEYIGIPSSPTNLTLQVLSNAQIRLTWQDQSNNEDGFKIERKTGASGTWSQIATVGANTTLYTDTNLSSGTTYVYRVRAYNTTGDSAYSNEASATTLPPPPTIVSPSTNTTLYPLQTITAQGTGSNLSWTIQWIKGSTTSTLQTGTGNSITFTVPREATNNEKIRILLQGDGGSTQQDHNIIDSFPSIVTTTLPNGQEGSAYSVSFQATGGNPPLTWSIISGSLPSGLTLSSTTGILSGTPLTNGTFTFTVQIEDNDGDYAQQDVILLIETSSDSPLFLQIISVSTGKAYQVVENVQVGTRVYTDRSYQFTQIDLPLRGGYLIQTANDDKYVATNDHIVFSLSERGTAYVLYDKRATTIPGWLSGWEETSITVISQDSEACPYRVYRKLLNAGTGSLGGNYIQGVSAHYAVIITPGDTTSWGVSSSTTENSSTTFTSSSTSKRSSGCQLGSTGSFPIWGLFLLLACVIRGFQTIPSLLLIIYFKLVKNER